MNIYMLASVCVFLMDLEWICVYITVDLKNSDDVEQVI